MRILRILSAVFAAAVVVLVIPLPARAEEYPSRPITVVVGFSAGGPMDSIARIVTEGMRQSLGQSFIIENVAGASGSIAVGRVARSAPDGYTLSQGYLGTHVLNGAVYRLAYDPVSDFEPVALVATNPLLVVARKDILANNLVELVAWLKAQPNPATQGLPGIGTPSHVAGAFFQQMTGAKLQFVPYRGTVQATQDLIGGQIDLMIDQISNALPHARSGTVKAYAVTAKDRSPLAPDIPTVDEAGLPGLYVAVWHGLWVPKGTPNEVITKLNRAVVNSLADPTVRRRLADMGLEVAPQALQTPEGLRAYQKAEIQKWWPIVKAANIKAE
jgi:tripartite-type tricarboxylate transporter receptor subunit TctC